MSYTYNEKYNFTETWFDPMIPIWEDIFNHLKNDGFTFKNVLEVGCFEGRSTVFTCDNILESGSEYTIVDTFGGTLEESGMGNTKNLLELNNDYIWDNFNHNISFFKDKINFTIHKGYSQQILPTLTGEYDMIYIDASHRADDTFVDAYFAHKMLKVNGIIIFDDFGWKDPAKPHVVDSPELGIRQFFTMYEDQYELIASGYQIFAIKTK